jgi:hypothetical protein
MTTTRRLALCTAYVLSPFAVIGLVVLFFWLATLTVWTCLVAVVVLLGSIGVSIWPEI